MKRILKDIVVAIIITTVAASLLIAIITNISRSLEKTIATSVSPDGVYELEFVEVGTAFSFGPSSVRITLNKGSKRISAYDSTIHNDGGALTSENWYVNWKQDCVTAILSGKEQGNETVTIYFDGTILTD